MGKGRPQCGPGGKHRYLDPMSMFVFLFMWQRLLVSGGRAAAALPAAVVVLGLLAAPSSRAFALFARPGRSDAEGKFVFDADQDGLWSAEARNVDYVARIMIRVGGEPQPHGWLSPFFVVGFLVVLLAIAVWYRLVRARTNRPRS